MWLSPTSPSSSTSSNQRAIKGETELIRLTRLAVAERGYYLALPEGQFNLEDKRTKPFDENAPTLFLGKPWTGPTIQLEYVSGGFNAGVLAATSKRVIVRIREGERVCWEGQGSGESGGISLAMAIGSGTRALREATADVFKSMPRPHTGLNN